MVMSFVVECRGCREIVPAPVEIRPAQPIAVQCPLCDEHWRYLPSQILWAPVSQLLGRKPVRTADRRGEKNSDEVLGTAVLRLIAK
jgi:hypothetical protein